MALFPTREPEIKALAQNIVTGLTDNAAVFTAPPVTPAALQAFLTSFITLGDECVAAQTAAKQATVTKNAGLDELTTAMKAVCVMPRTRLPMMMPNWPCWAGAPKRTIQPWPPPASPAPGRGLGGPGLERADRRRSGGLL